MIDPARRRELIRKVGGRRIIAAPDLMDTWSRRFAASAKPAAVMRTLLVASVSVIVAGTIGACALSTAGLTIVDKEAVRLARVVSDIVPDAAALSKSALRIKFRAASRAIAIVDETILARPVDPAALTWFERVFGRPAPQVNPGREAVLLGIVDRVTALPVDQRADAVDDMMLWVTLGQNREAWKVMMNIAGQPPETRKALLSANYEGLRQVLAWLQERQKGSPAFENLAAAVDRHRLELAGENTALEAINQTLRQAAEGIRGRRFACRRQASELETCLGQAAPWTPPKPPPHLERKVR